MKALKTTSTTGVDRAGTKVLRGHPFTLVEVMVAVTVLAFGMVGVVAAYHRAAFSLGRAQESIAAYALLREKMGTVEEDAREENGLAHGRFTGTFIGAQRGFGWQLTVLEGPFEKTDEVALTVQHLGSERSYTLVTILPSLATKDSR